MSIKQISYMTPLYNLAVEQPHVKRILELGCGCSSYILRWAWPNADYVLIDDHPVWISGNENMGGHYKIQERILIEGMTRNEKRGNFMEAIKGNGTFDFIFIDCGHVYDNSDSLRADYLDCILENGILDKDGAIMVHDANRPEYKASFLKWEYVRYEKYNTAILWHKQEDKNVVS